MKTVVYQSYKPAGGPAWIGRCLDSVRGWAELRGFDYRFIGDEIFDLVPGWYREKAAGQIPIVTDLGRLLLAHDFLGQGYERTVWLDADALIFDPDGFRLSVTGEYAFGDEVWVQPGKTVGSLRAYRNVHNAISVFTAGNSFLDFYIHACQSVLERVTGGVPPQIVGPKLLSALHNIIGFKLISEVGMLSPLVVRDIAAGGGPALDLLRCRSRGPLRAVNLCTSLAGKTKDGVTLSDDLLGEVCECLLRTGGTAVNQTE